MKNFRKSLWLIALFNVFSVYAYEGTFDLIYFIRNTSARSEAMGKCRLLPDGGLFSAYYNPGFICMGDDIKFNVSYSTPMGLMDEVFYTFGGAGYEINKFIAIGLSGYHWNMGEDFDITGIDDTVEVSYRPYISDFKLTVGSEPLDGYCIGLNVNFFKNEMFPEGNSNVYLDMGLLKRFTFTTMNIHNHQIDIGASEINFLARKLVHEDTVYDYGYDSSYMVIEELDLPRTMLLNLSYKFTYYAGPYYGDKNVFSILSSLEYQDVIGYEYNTAWHFGMEALFFDIVYLRIGYYKEKNNDHGYEFNKDYITDFTYGLGAKMNFMKDNKLRIGLDFVRMPQTLGSNEPIFDLEDFYGLDLNISYGFD